MNENLHHLARLQAEQLELEHERQRLKWFLLLALTTWPIGLIWKAWVAVVICLTWTCFYLAGVYFSFFHRRECARRLEDALK